VRRAATGKIHTGAIAAILLGALVGPGVAVPGWAQSAASGLQSSSEPVTPKISVLAGRWLNFDPVVKPMYGSADLVHGESDAHLKMMQRTERMPKSLILGTADGEVPYLPWAKAKRDERTAMYENAPREDLVPTGARCLLYGVPHSMLRSNVQVYVFPTHVLMLWEYPAMHRIIWTDGRPPLDPEIKLWQGYSAGRWEGDTLTVTTTNQNGFPWQDQVGNFFSENVRVTETFKVVGPSAIDYRVTIADPSVYTQPWSMAWRFTRLDIAKPGASNAAVKGAVSASGLPSNVAEMFSSPEILEVACVEGDRIHALERIREEEKARLMKSKSKRVKRGSR